MASSAVHVNDTLRAIRDGTIPGALSEDRTQFVFPTLSYPNSAGNVMLWTISVAFRVGTAPAAVDDSMLLPGAILPPRHFAFISVQALQRGGKIRPSQPTRVSAGKNLGKKNATNAFTQALRDALGLYNKQRKRACPEAGPEASPTARPPAARPPAARPGRAARQPEDAPGGSDAPPPMLVKAPGASREANLTPANFAEGVTVQTKFNGVRYVTHAAAAGADPRRVVAYSRTSTAYPGQEQVASELLPILALAPAARPGSYGIPPDAPDRVVEAYAPPAGPLPYLDGELYLHGKSLNWISGQARKSADSGQLKYYVFDVFFPTAKAAGHDMTSRHRQAYLDDLFAAAGAAGLHHPHIVRVPNHPAHSMEEVQELARGFLAEGYEGAIARKDNGTYRYSHNGYHSDHLVKIKPKHDDEFPVVGFTQGSRGKDVGAVMWICEVPAARAAVQNDRTFNVVPKDMTYKQRYAIYKCLGQSVAGPDGSEMTRFERDVKGLPLTVEYAEISAKTGKPLQAKALAFRTYEGGPEKDPIRALLLECGAARA